MADFILIFVIGAILGFAIGYIRKAKKQGRKCIGCPHGGSCGGGCSCSK